MKKLILLFATFGALFALPLNDLRPSLEKDLSTALVILKKNESVEQKANELFNIFDVYFDFGVMSKLSLGSLANKLNDEQKAQFQKIFEKRLKFSFSEKLGLYTNQQIFITKEERPNEKRYFIHSEIKNQNNETFPLIFKFHQASPDNFLLYDVDVLGVSLIQTYRAQFNDLKDASFEQILERLNATNSLDKK